jgi:hypothetical protein
MDVGVRLRKFEGHHEAALGGCPVVNGVAGSAETCSGKSEFALMADQYRRIADSFF